MPEMETAAAWLPEQLAASIAGSGHAAIYVVLLASGSAAVLLPALQETGLSGPDVMSVMAQVTIADVITILAVPGVISFAVFGRLERWVTRGQEAKAII